MKKTCLFILAIIIFAFGCKKDENENTEEKENIYVTVNLNQINVYNGMELTITATAIGGEIREAFFYFDGINIGSSIMQPYSIKYLLKDIEPGNHIITCIVKSHKNNDFQGEANLSLSLRLGDEYKGGKIFFLNEDGISGLIGATEDYKEVISHTTYILHRWGNDGIIGTDIYDGQKNTNLMATHPITSESGFGILFKNGLNYNGYNDWYIPSYEELLLFERNQGYVGNFNLDVPNEAIYWSSSEIDETRAYLVNFRNLTGHNYKSKFFRIRPIRKF